MKFEPFLPTQRKLAKSSKKKLAKNPTLRFYLFFLSARNADTSTRPEPTSLTPKPTRSLTNVKALKSEGKLIAGCGHEGEVDIKSGEGKLTWKSEFAARWKALDIRFEAYGKDIADSVRINDRICREVLCFEPPSHAKYEMFLDKGGKKISKSAGNVFTPQVWFHYGSPQSLLLLMLKRFVGTRTLDVSDIPAYMNEMDYFRGCLLRQKTGQRKRSYETQRLIPILLRHEAAS